MNYSPRRLFLLTAFFIMIGSLAQAATYPCTVSWAKSEDATTITINLEIRDGNNAVRGATTLVKNKAEVDVRAVLSELLYYTREYCLAILQGSDIPASGSRSFNLLDLYSLPEGFME